MKVNKLSQIALRCCILCRRWKVSWHRNV